MLVQILWVTVLTFFIVLAWRARDQGAVWMAIALVSLWLFGSALWSSLQPLWEAIRSERLEGQMPRVTIWLLLAGVAVLLAPHHKRPDPDALSEELTPQ